MKKYVGRKYDYGKVDCYSLVRDFYKDEFGIELTNYARPEDWFDKGANVYMENFRSEGFYLVEENEELLYGDVFLIAFGTQVASHAAIYVGDNEILHHPLNRISAVDKYKGIWKNWTVARVRHVSKKGQTKEKIEYVFKQER